MNPIETISANCRDLAALRGRLRKKFEARQQAVNAAVAEFDRDIRDLQSQCALSRVAIQANLEASRQLFMKPKTREFAGIIVGFEKERDTLTLPPDEILVDRIEKLLPAKQAGTVLDRSVSIIRNAFKKLPREILQKLGCNLVAGADKPVVRANDDDIETLVHKSLGEAVSAPVPPGSPTGEQ